MIVIRDEWKGTTHKANPRQVRYGMDYDDHVKILGFGM